MARKTTARRPVGIDLFAGAGGMSLGFEQAGFDVRACVELDPVHCATHEYNFPRCAVICKSADSVTGREILEAAGVRPGGIDVVFGGPPCQGFSMMGKRALDDPRNSLVGHFLRIVDELRPKYFVFENVKGLTVGRHRRFLVELLAEFEAIGYDVRQPTRVLNAANYGVPQSRERLFLLGARAPLAAPDYPDALTAMPGAKNPAGLPPVPTVADALGDLPDAEDYEELRTSDSAKVRFGRASAYARFLRGLAKDPADRSHRRSHRANTMTSSLRSEHTALSRKRFAKTAGGETEPVSRFFKLDPSGICNTLRAGTASDRGAFTSPRPIHPHHARCITVREAARLHSYPDWFRFHVTKWHGARQIGNSVPPLLARAVASRIVAAMGIDAKKPAETLAHGDEGLLSLNMQQACEHYGVPSNTIAQRTRRGMRAMSGSESKTNSERARLET